MLVPLLAGCAGSGTSVAGISPAATVSGAVVPSALTEPPTASPPPPNRPFSLVLNNVDGAVVALYLNGQYIGGVACALDPAASPIPPLSPGASLRTPFAPAGTLPPLPWKVIVVTGPGIIIGQYDEDGRAGPRAIVVRGTTTAETAAPGDPGLAAVGPCATPGTIPALALQNGTTIEVTLVVNGTTVRTFGPRTCAGCSGADGIQPSELGPLPWTVEARSPSGRVLLSMTVHPGDYFQTAYPDGHGSNGGAAARADLSCGRIDMWAGPPLLGPAPGPGSPGDCAP